MSAKQFVMCKDRHNISHFRGAHERWEDGYMIRILYHASPLPPQPTMKSCVRHRARLLLIFQEL